MIQNNWQHQASLKTAQPSEHHGHQSPANDISEQQMHDIFNSSTRRPISAPPMANESVHVMNGMGNGGFSSSTTNNEKTWGEISLISNSTKSENSNGNPHDNNKNNDHFHLRNSHFNFNPLKEGTVEQNNDILHDPSQKMNRIGLDTSSSSVPPGLGIFTSDNNSSNDSNGVASPNHQSLYEKFDVMQIGSRRPASTGVIGQNSRTSISPSVMESLGLIPTSDGLITGRKQKPIMDLIQEDFPKTPSPEYPTENLSSNGNFPSQNGFHQTATTSSQPVTSATSSTTTSSATTAKTAPSIQYNIHNQHKSMTAPHVNFPTKTNNFDNDTPVQHHRVYSNHTEVSSHTASNGYLQGDVRTTHTHNNYRREGIYPSVVPPNLQNNSVHPHHHLIHQRPSTYEHQHHPMYYNTQRRNDIDSGTHRIMQTQQNAQHSIYVNPAPYTGYTTVQYHHQAPPPPTHFHHPSPVVIHSHDPAMASRYISAIPVQGPIPAQVPTNGAYIYFQQPSNAPAINVIPATSNHNSKTRSPYKGSTRNSGNDRSRKNNRTKSNGLNDPNTSNASSVLEEFRAEKNRSWTAFDAKGHIVEFCQDQNGSRFIQQRLEIAKEAEKTFILSEILPEIHKLRIDIFGNYVVQKLFDFGTPEMINEVKETIAGNMLTLSNQIYGCRVVQKALEIVSDEDLLELLSELHDKILSCIHDQNGNHVIQKYIEVVNKRITESELKGDTDMALRFKHEAKILLNCVTEDVLALSCHPYGCRVFQRILEHFNEEQKDHVLNCISCFHQQLLDDQYGNYVIQHVLRFGRTYDRDSILDIVVKNSLLHLSRQKFASNVVEKLLKFGNDNHRKVIIREMLKKVPMSGIDGTTDMSSVVLMMVRDAYANYVVQTTLDVVPEGEEKRLLFEELNSHAALLRNFTFAKHIITKLESN